MWDSARGGSQPLALRLSVANGRDQILRVTRSRIYLRQRIEVKNRIRNTKLKKKKRKGEGEGEGKEIEMQNKEAGPMWGKEEVLVLLVRRAGLRSAGTCTSWPILLNRIVYCPRIIYYTLGSTDNLHCTRIQNLPM